MWALFFGLGVAITAVGSYLFIKRVRRFVSNHGEHKLSKDEFNRVVTDALIIGIGGIFFQLAINFAANLDLNVAQQIFSSLGFGALFVSNALGWGLFYIHYWKEDLDKTYKNYVFRCMIIEIPVAIMAFLCTAISVGDAIAYPLISGFNFGGNPFFTSRFAI